MSAVRVLTSVSYDCALLPHFVGYYRGLGVEAFAVTVHEQVPEVWRQTARTAAALGGEIALLPASAWQQRTGVEGANKEDLRQRVARPEDWLIPADLDEFIQFPTPLPELIAEMNHSGADYLTGRFRDRIARDGQLAPMKDQPTLWEQYPLECEFSARLVQCLCTKVVLCRGNCALGSGHHFVVSAARELTGRSAAVHHFKWRAGLLEALRRRAEIPRREGVPWAGESERVLAYFAREGRIVPEHFAARPGWQPPR